MAENRLLRNALFDRSQAREELYFRPKRKPTPSNGWVTEGRKCSHSDDDDDGGDGDGSRPVFCSPKIDR